MRLEDLQESTWYLIELDSKIQTAYYYLGRLPWQHSSPFTTIRKGSVVRVAIPQKDIYKRVFRVNKLWNILYET
jgi:hypothetical protein